MATERDRGAVENGTDGGSGTDVESDGDEEQQHDQQQGQQSPPPPQQQGQQWLTVGIPAF